MTEKIKILALALLLAAGLMLASFFAGWSLCGHQQEPISNDTITIMKVDTVTLVEPMVDTLIRFVDRLYPVAVHDTTLIHHHTTDSIWISLPYEHRYMAKEDTLEVWYSGIDPKIDSAKVYMHHTTEIVNHIADVSKMMPRLTAGVGCGAFYQEKRVNAYLFGEMRYNTKKSTFAARAAIDQNGRWCVGGEVSWRFTLF
ncbi:MAG: hypothetical protein IIZ94_14640 [Prevotella sp.]|nr:hypothetical protein [Prevotella sp.]